MRGIEPMNGWIFIRPIAETKSTGGLELIAKYDEQDRYSKAEVVFAQEDSPLKCCDIILHDKSNGHGFQHEGEMLTVLRLGDVVGVL